MPTHPDPSVVSLRIIPRGDILSLAAHRRWTSTRQWPAAHGTRVTITLTAGRVLPNDAWVHALILTSPPVDDVTGRTVLVTGAWEDSVARFRAGVEAALSAPVATDVLPGLCATLDRWDAAWRATQEGAAYA